MFPHTRLETLPYKTTRQYSLFQKRLKDPAKDSSSTLVGKTVLVTGANTGLGFEAALKVASLRAKHVILGVRDLEKGENARNRIFQRLLSIGSPTSLAATDTGNTKISVHKLDMNEYESIHGFVERIRENGPLDAAILNAGVFGVRYETTSKYGWENDLQVNFLSTALLALLLLRSKMIKPGTGILEFVASRRMEAVKLTEEEVRSPNLLETFNQKHEKFDASRQYQVSKLLLAAFVKALAARSNDSSQENPIITAVCPGFCQSDLSRGHQGFAADMLRAILNTFVLRSAEEGARTLVSGMYAGRAAHGFFWFDDEIHDLAMPDSVGNAQQFADQIWREVLAALQKDTNFRLL